ncbi:MAG: UDP-N-acetylmuramoylalanine--D-glutamate ligase [SAR86 cluster bacterium]|jgi:UDP-N-acetylmuramoylalanine--D-glutamate ligase|nr:UDP-N-acetylmuramoylalanine--D-glutamate ligase [SAR86 cluster bacterium]MDC0332489.1 Mur ligase family protein [Gammaproteobacteria bacterium]
MKSLIFGYGITGQSFERYLTKKDIAFDIYDKNLKGPNISNHLPDQTLLSSYEMIYLSPGINLKKLYTKGEFNKLAYLTDLDIFFQEDSSYKIGVTGTNGKSTCCYQLHQLLEDSQLIGNIGTPVLDGINSCSYSIIELSSFQLEKVKDIKLDFGVLLNIAPDHIDHHGTFAEYTNVKKRIKESKISTQESNPKKLWSMITGRKLREVQDIALHELPHRRQHVGIHNQLVFINDSKATNLTALKFALNKMSSPYVLILCGDPSKEQYDSYKIIGPTKVYIFGKHAEEISKKIFHPDKILLCNQGLSSVMNLIFKDVYHCQTNILFSPGHPSGQDYKNFEERGDHFIKLALGSND